MKRQQIRAVAFREGDVWVVQGVEYDIVAQTATKAGARDAFIRTLFSTLMVNRKLGREGFESIPKAPARYLDMFKRAQDRLAAEHDPPPPDDMPPPKLDVRLYRPEAH